MFESPLQPKETLPNPFETWLSSELSKQYELQVTTLDRLGLLQILPESNSYGILDINGTECPFPELEILKQELLKNREFFQKKWKQGFTELQITPFGLPLSSLIEKMKKVILKHHQEGKLFGTKKDQNDPDEALVPLELDTETPLYVWDKYEDADENGSLVYFPKQFTKENHGGKTKKEVLDDMEDTSFPGYLISFLEKDTNIKRQGKGVIRAGRKQIETNQTPNEYLKKFQTESIYQGESGETPEEWLIQFLIHLEQTNQVIDDYQGKGSANYLTGGYFSASGYVSSVCWSRDRRQAYLSWYDSWNQVDVLGCRSAVRV